MALMGRPIRNMDSSVRSSTPQPASSVTSRWAVETGRQVSRAISVSECSLPSWKVSRIATILLVTDRPGSAELPAIGPPFPSSGTEMPINVSKEKGTRHSALAQSAGWGPDHSDAPGKPRGPFLGSGHSGTTSVGPEDGPSPASVHDGALPRGGRGE